jgi:hypothetical protein
MKYWKCMKCGFIVQDTREKKYSNKEFFDIVFNHKEKCVYK